MGRRRLAHHGIDSATYPRLRIRLATVRLSDRIFSRFDRLRAVVSVYRLARHVHGRRHSRAARVLHPAQRAGTAELAADHAPQRQYMDDTAVTLASWPLCHRADDRVQFLQPRHAGPLSDFSAGPAQDVTPRSRPD